MNRFRQGWLEKAFATAEAEIDAAASAYFSDDVPPEYHAITTGAITASISAVDSIPALAKLWGLRGSTRQATGLIRVLSLHAVSTWLTSEDGLPEAENPAALRLEWARHFLHIFGMHSDQNASQFQLRDLQAGHDADGRGTPVISMYLLLSDMLRALGDTTRGPLVQAPTVPLDDFDDLVISKSFEERVSPLDVTTLAGISRENRNVCRDAFREPTDDAAPEPEEELDLTGLLAVLPATEAVEDELDVAEPDVEAPVAEAAEEPPPAEQAELEAEIDAAEDADDELPALEEEPPEVREEQQAFVFAEDGVGIVSVYNEAVPEWRPLGLARGSVSGPAGQPLRITVNLSRRAALDSLDEVARAKIETMDTIMIDLSAGSVLVPLEYEYLKPLSCPRCGCQERLSQLKQESLEIDYHPEPSAWPFTSASGDRHTLGCPDCDFLFEVVFWFWE